MRRYLTKRVLLITLFFAVLIGVIVGIVVWDFTEPWTIAYEINPVTFEVRYVEYLDRPITGVVEYKVVAVKEMAIGRWLKENGYLQVEDEGAGYWELLKSYSPRRGFVKGRGRLLQPLFEVDGVATPMPVPSVESENKRWVDWCTKNPRRASFVWKMYRTFAEDPEQLDRAADALWFAINFSDEYTDSEFESILVQRAND